MFRILPPRPHLEHLKTQAKTLLRELERGDAPALERYLVAWGKPHIPPAQLADAQLVIAREYGFPSWPKLKSHLEALGREEDPVDALVSAVKENDLPAMNEMLDRVPSLRDRLNESLPGLPFGGTLLLAAVHHRNREMVDRLLAAGASINQKSHWWAGGFGVLDSASPDLAPWLIERGAILEPVAAARLGMIDALRAMVASDPAAVHARGGDGHTPLHEATTQEIAKFLVEHGADVNARDVDHESTPAQYHIRERQDIARYLVEQGATTDILMAAALGDLALVRRHLDAEPSAIRVTASARSFPMKNPHAGGPIYFWTLGRDRSPHGVAKEFGHEAVVELLLERTPDDLKLALAAELGDEALLGQLLAANPRLVQTLPAAEQKKLPDAARDSNGATLRLMLEAGWPVDARGDHGATALHWASWHGNREMVEEILRHQPSLEIRSEDFDMTPLGWLLHGSVNGWYCETGDHPGTLEVLLKAGAKVPDISPESEMSDGVRAVLANSVSRKR